jgi:hypothetical protein
VVALVDRLLPGSSAPLGTLPAAAQLGLAGAALAIGGALFVVGRRWR